jgi:hypothetical protein
VSVTVVPGRGTALARDLARDLAKGQVTDQAMGPGRPAWVMPTRTETDGSAIPA